MAFEADGLYLGHNEHIKRVTKNQQTRQDRMIAWCKEKYPLHEYHRAAKITRALRPIKSVEAELTYNLVRSGGSHHAFMPIVASGKNACALHYNTNDDVCQDGEMVLLDFGVCYANYNSDTTRCFPVNGTFSKRQAAIYSSVLYCLKEGSKLLKPGVIHAEYEQQMGQLVEAQLIKLELLDAAAVAAQDPEKPLYKKRV